MSLGQAEVGWKVIIDTNIKLINFLIHQLINSLIHKLINSLINQLTNSLDLDGQAI